jgi:TolB-like protein
VVTRSPQVKVTGALRRSGELYVVELRLVDPARNEQLLTAHEQGRGKQSIPQLIDHVAEQVRKHLEGR